MSRFWKIWGKSAINEDFLDNVTTDARDAAEAEELRLSQYEVGELNRLLAVSTIPGALNTVGDRVAALSTLTTQSDDFQEFLGALVIDPLLRTQVRSDGSSTVAGEQFLTLSAVEKQLIDDLLDDQSASDAMDTVTNDGWFISCSLGLLDDPDYDHSKYTPQP